MTSQSAKAEAFQQLHAADGAFVIPNPWDAGSARMMQNLGFKALATTSSGFAQSLGRLDGQVSLEEKLAHCRDLAAITDIPISADLENGFGDSPEAVAECIARAAETGLVGGSIEDYTGDPAAPMYDFELSVERVAAAVEAVRAQPFPFTLTARAENLLRVGPDLDEAIRRLKAYADAGADVLYAPALKTLDEVRRVAAEVDKPINVLASTFKAHSLAELADAGATRISLGGSLARLMAGVLLRTGREMLDEGSFRWLDGIAAPTEVDQALA